MKKINKKLLFVILGIFLVALIFTSSNKEVFQTLSKTVSKIANYFEGAEEHVLFKTVELREGSEKGKLIANLLENNSPQIEVNKEYYITVTLNTPNGSNGFFNFSLADEKAYGFNFINIPGQKYTPSAIDSDSFDYLKAFEETEDLTYGAKNNTYSLKDGTLKYSIKDAKMNGKELYASFGFRLDEIAWNPLNTNILDAIKISVGTEELVKDELKISTKINNTKNIYLSGSSNTFNATRTVPQVGLSLTLNSIASSPILYDEIGYKVTYPNVAEFRGASFSATNITSLTNDSYGTITVSEPIDNGDGTLTKEIKIGPGKKEQSGISGFIYNHVIFGENSKINSTYTITYSDMYYIPRGDTRRIESTIGSSTSKTLSYDYKIFSEEVYVDRSQISAINRTGNISVFNWNVNRDKNNIIKTNQFLGGASLVNTDTMVTKYRKTVKASYNITSEFANIDIVTIPSGLIDEENYKTSLDVKYVAIKENGEEVNGTITINKILGSVNKYVVFKAIDVGAVSIKSIEADVGYLPINYYSSGWSASNSLSSNMFAAYGYFTDNTVGNRVKNTFEVMNSEGEGESNSLKTTSYADSAGEAQLVFNNQFHSGESKTSLSVVAGNSIELKNKKISPYYVINGSFANTSVVANPVIYIYMPKGMSFSNLIVKKETVNNYISGRNKKEDISYTINNITYLNNLDDDVNIYKVTFDDKNLVIGTDCNEYADSVSLYVDVKIKTMKTMTTSVYDFDTLFNVTSETPVNVKEYPSGASKPVADKYNLNDGFNLGGARLYNTTLNGISVQRLDALTVDNAISISKVDGVSVDEATRTWDTYDETNQNSISYMGYNTEGEYRVRIQNPSSSPVTDFKMIIPIPKASTNIGSAFTKEPCEFNMTMSPKELSGYTSKYIKIDEEIIDGAKLANVEYSMSDKNNANAILITKDEIAAYENDIVYYDFVVKKDASVVKGAFNSWRNFFGYVFEEESFIEGYGSYVATEIAASEITGTVFIDENNNEYFDDNEKTLKGINVVVTDSLGRVQFAETDDEGKYNISQVREDNIEVKMAIPTEKKYWFAGSVWENVNGIYNNVNVTDNRKEAIANIYTKGEVVNVNASLNSIHTIKYYANGGAGNPPSSSEYMKNTTAKIATPPSGMILNGAEFIGWSYESVPVSDDNTDKVAVRPGDIITVKDNIDLYAVYQNKYIKLTFDFQGGHDRNNKVNDFKYVQAGKKLNATDKDGKGFPIPEREGYTFWKWEVASGELGRGNGVSGDTVCAFEEDTIIRAVFLKLNKNVDSIDLTVGDKSNNFYDLNENLTTDNLPGFYNYGLTYEIDNEALPEGVAFDEGTFKGNIKTLFDKNVDITVKQSLNATGTSYKTFKFTMRLKSNPKDIDISVSSNIEGGVVVNEEKQLIEISANITGLANGINVNENNNVKFIATDEDGNKKNIGTSEIENGIAKINWEINNSNVGVYKISATIENLVEEYNILNNTAIPSFVISEQEIEKHTVSFDTTGYDIEINDKIYVHNSMLGDLPNIKLNGYIFDGWFNNDVKVSKTDQVSEDIVLKAKYHEIEYKVIYRSNDLQIEIPDKKTTYNAINLLPTSGFLKDGYLFTGWQLENGTKVNETTKYSDLVTSDTIDKITLYATYTPKEYTVTYNSMGGSIGVNQFKVKYNNIYGELVTPTLIGSNFKGWYNENDVLVSGSDKYLFTNNTTLTAKWEYKSGYTVKYNSNGGTLINDKQVKWNELAIPDKIPTKTGYTFKGWSYEETEVLENASYGSLALNDKLESITLIAEYTPNEYTLVYDGNGIEISETKKILYNEKYGELLSPTKVGSNFKGWFNEEGKQVTKDDLHKLTSNITLKAKWEYKSGYTIKFNVDEDATKVDEQEANWNTLFSELKTKTHKDGYKFIGWYYGEKLIKNTDTYGTITEEDTITNIELDARFEYRNDYKVSFVTNSEITYQSINLHYDDIIDVTEYKPTRKGHTFLGWMYNNELIDKPKYFELAKKDTNEEIILVAKWQIDYTYDFIKGDVQKFTEGQVSEYIIKIDGDYSLFNNIQVQGLTLEKDLDYKVTEGSTIITFTTEGLKKLNTLKVGTYEVEVTYDNSKSVIGKLIIEKSNNPLTLDNIMTYIILFIISVIGIISALLFVRKKH